MKQDLTLKQLLIISVLLLSVASCNKDSRKDPLVGDVAFLVGEWNWEWTRDTYDFCDPMVSEIDTILASSIPDSYSLNFKEKGIIEYFKNGEKFDEKDIHLGNITVDGNNTLFDIYPDDENDLRHGCFWDGTELAMGRFPYPLDESGCHIIGNYFTKE
jgi:hypothetical protein